MWEMKDKAYIRRFLELRKYRKYGQTILTNYQHIPL